MSKQHATTKQHGRPGTIVVTVKDRGSDAVLSNAAVSLYKSSLADCKAFTATNWAPDPDERLQMALTDSQGIARFAPVEEGAYVLVYEHYPRTAPQCIEVEPGACAVACFAIGVDATVVLRYETPDCEPSKCAHARIGDRAVARISFTDDAKLAKYVHPAAGVNWVQSAGDPLEFSQTIRRAGIQTFDGSLEFDRMPDASAGAALAAADAGGGGRGAMMVVAKSFAADERPATPITGNLGMSLSRTETEPTEDLPLWTLIRNSTEAMSFNNYMSFMDALFCTDTINLRGFELDRFGRKAEAFAQLRQRRALPFSDSDAYRVLKVATEAFVMVNCGVMTQPFAFNPAEDRAYLDRRDIPLGRDLETVLTEDYLETVDGTQVLPYLSIIRRKLPDVPITLPSGLEGDAEMCFGIVQQKLANPCLLELIWSYWHEEGMLVQTMNAITQRFQNVLARPNDPLANLEIDPLRPLNNLIWGYTQDEQHRLTVVRRNYEYDHHYGVRLDGKAVQHFRPADSRSKFLEAFHYLMRLCTVFYRQDDDTTVKADAFPVLNALKEVHLILSQGAHNQFGDLPSTARIEMLMQQWMLARPEFREFLPTRIMVAYPEPWMDRVDAMKKLQNWSDTSVLHFRNLALFGEQILLSVRYGNWSDIYEPTQAFNWARFWRPQIQGYIHAYRAATGVDLGAENRDPNAEGTLPSVLLRQRLAQQARATL